MRFSEYSTSKSFPSLFFSTDFSFYYSYFSVFNLAFILRVVTSFLVELTAL